MGSTRTSFSSQATRYWSLLAITTVIPDIPIGTTSEAQRGGNDDAKPTIQDSGVSGMMGDVEV